MTTEATANSTIEPSRISAIKIGIAVIPALLILSICIALYLGANEEQEKSKPIEGQITVSEMSDYLSKLNGRIGERNFESEEGMLGLRQVSAMVQGNLGPENMGYRVDVSQNDSSNGFLWKTLWITAGDEEGKDVVLVAVPYSGSGTAVSFAFGFAEYLTSHSVKETVRIVFYPPLVDSDTALKNWLWDRCSGEGESLKNFVHLTGDGPDPQGGQWASISPTSGELSLFTDLVAKKGWEGNVVLDEPAKEGIVIHLGERGSSSLDNHSGRLIRMMPLIRELVMKLGE